MVDMSTKATKATGHGERINKMGWEVFVIIKGVILVLGLLLL